MGDTPVFDFDFVRWFPHLSSGLQSRIFHADWSPASFMRKRATLVRMFHADSSSASFMRDAKTYVM